MATTQPIKDKQDLTALKDYYLHKKPNFRNYALIVTGINTALRIGDILNLTWDSVYNFDKDTFRKHITLREGKTNKENVIAMNENIYDVLSQYKESLYRTTPQQYLFPGRPANQPLSRSQAFRIIKNACSDLQFPENISCHSLRKTFGYHAWTSGANPTMLMLVYNHSSFGVTKRYLGVEQEDKDQLFLTLKL